MIKLISYIFFCHFPLGTFSIDSQNIQFQLSAQSLQSKTELRLPNPYVQLYFVDNDHVSEVKFGQSFIAPLTVDPTWENIFEFEYNRSKSQRWRFQVDDYISNGSALTLGKAWTTVDDFIDHEQQLKVNLEPIGIIKLTSVNPVVSQVDSLTSGQIRSSSENQHLNQESKPHKLLFKLSARDLPNTDVFGTIDPYIKLFYTDEKTKLEKQFGRTAIMDEQENPDFTQVFQFTHLPGTKQKWHFLILDDNGNKSDEIGGEAFIDVDEYVRKKDNPIIIDMIQGQLLIHKVESALASAHQMIPKSINATDVIFNLISTLQGKSTPIIRK